MTWTKIGEWVRASGLRQEWTPGMNGGAIRALKDKGEIEKTGGLFRVVASSELSAAEFGASSYEPSREPSERPAAGDHMALIPCYGLNWDRNQIEWDRKPQLLGSPRDDNSTKVNFAGQFGVYVLYEWPNVTYAGRTTEGHLYDRLLRHTKDPRIGWFDRFSWFGLLSVGADQKLESPREHLDMKQAIKAMEAILIEILSPPFNKNRGEFLGTRYRQVRVVDELSADKFREALGRK